MSSFVTSTFSDGNDTSLQLANEEWVRTLTIGSNWTHIRIGVLWAISGVASISANFGFAIGMCAGTAAPFGNAACTNFVGVWNNASLGWTANSSNPYFSFSNTSIFAAKKIASTTTTYGFDLPDSSGWALPTTSGTARRGISYVDITKGSPTYTVSMNQILNGNIATDFTVPNLLSGMTQASGSIVVGGVSLSDGNHAQSVTTDESLGGFDTVDIYSGLLNNFMEVYEVAVQKIA